MRERGGKEKYVIRRKKHKMRETWEITGPYGEDVLAQITYAQKFIFPGCSILLADGKKVTLRAKFGLAGTYALEGCPLEGDVRSPYPYVLKEKEKEVARISLVHPGEKVAYDMEAEYRDLLLCTAVFAGYIMCSRMN